MADTTRTQRLVFFGILGFLALLVIVIVAISPSSDSDSTTSPSSSSRRFTLDQTIDICKETAATMRRRYGTDYWLSYDKCMNDSLREMLKK